MHQCYYEQPAGGYHKHRQHVALHADDGKASTSHDGGTILQPKWLVEQYKPNDKRPTGRTVHIQHFEKHDDVSPMSLVLARPTGRPTLNQFGSSADEPYLCQIGSEAIRCQDKTVNASQRAKQPPKLSTHGQDASCTCKVQTVKVYAILMLNMCSNTNSEFITGQKTHKICLLVITRSRKN